MTATTCNLARAQSITVSRAPIHTERLALGYRHRYLRGADTEALDRVRATTNEYNTTDARARIGVVDLESIVNSPWSFGVMLQGDTVDAVAQASRIGTVRENMA
jgi:hypothetical protein